ncbi:MAG: hypothetical protein JO283_21600 [Bradyrhizobium sp.]|nr:hypothetical protein [Bradyrhizobium sp.]
MATARDGSATIKVPTTVWDSRSSLRFETDAIDIADFRAAIAVMVHLLKLTGSLLIANLTSFTSACGEHGSTKDADARHLHHLVEGYLEGVSFSIELGNGTKNWQRPLSAYTTAFLEHGLDLNFFSEAAPVYEMPISLSPRAVVRDNGWQRLPVQFSFLVVSSRRGDTIRPLAPKWQARRLLTDAGPWQSRPLRRFRDRDTFNWLAVASIDAAYDMFPRVREGTAAAGPSSDPIE